MDLVLCWAVPTLWDKEKRLNAGLGSANLRAP